MVVNLGGVNSERKEYIQEEGYMTLKVVEVKFLKIVLMVILFLSLHIKINMISI